MTARTEIATFVGADEAEISARRAATRLRNLLRLNAEFSVLSGAAGLVAAGPVADLIGVDQVWLVRSVGAGLVGFAAVVFAIAGARAATLRRWSQIVSMNDLGWVAATIVVVTMGWLSGVGVVVMGLVGVVVFGLGMSQLRAQRRLVAAMATTGADLEESPPVEIIEFSVASANTAKALWPVMTDHELYAGLAFNLRSARGLSPNGLGLRRSCTDRIGRTWSETCTLWDEGRRFDVDVDVDDYPYPLQIVQGSWWVEPAVESSSTIGMRFAIQPRPGLRGRLFVVAMHLVFAPILKRIARGWELAASRSAVS